MFQADFKFCAQESILAGVKVHMNCWELSPGLLHVRRAPCLIQTHKHLAFHSENVSPCLFTIATLKKHAACNKVVLDSSVSSQRDCAQFL